MSNNGQNLQRLIRIIESARHVGEPVKIESPKRIRDKKTNNLREHDVVLTITHAHHELIVALECRDRSRPVGVDAVEAFHTKCQDTGISSGIIVSASGFRPSAITKAAAYNIRCLTLDQVEGYDWCGLSSMTIVNSKLTRAALFIAFPDGTNVSEEQVLTLDGNAITQEVINGWAIQMYREAENVDRSPGTHKHRFRDPKPPIYAQVGDQRVDAAFADLSIEYTVTETQSPLELQSYNDRTSAKHITETAVGKFTIAGKSGDLIFAKNEDGTIGVSIVPDAGQSSKRRILNK